MILSEYLRPIGTPTFTKDLTTILAVDKNGAAGTSFEAAVTATNPEPGTR